MLSGLHKLFLTTSLFLPLAMYAQPGKHTIPGENSTQSKTFHYKPGFVANLPEAAKETSGLVFFGGTLWTINDSGNPAEIIQLDTTSGSIIRKVLVNNAVNADWEAITQDDSNIYIGDFGNNYGNRTNLCILKIPKNNLIKGSDSTVKASFIHFRYPDQSVFTKALNNNNFDCEAFIYHADSLHLFTKDWLDLQTRHYVIPTDTGTCLARLAEQFNSDGLITDASINEQGSILLLGYKNTRGKSYSSFCWLLTGYKGNSVFTGTWQRIELGSALHLGQTEGISFANENLAWLSSESILSGWLYRPAKLYRINIESFFPSAKP